MTVRPTDVRLTDDFLATLAARYKAANIPGTPPVAHIAAHYYPGHPKRTVERWVYTARQRGYLPKVGQGRTRGDRQRWVDLLVDQHVTFVLAPNGDLIIPASNYEAGSWDGAPTLADTPTNAGYQGFHVRLTFDDTERLTMFGVGE